MANRVSSFPTQLFATARLQRVRVSELLRRAFDILAASLGLLLLAPLFLWIAWRIGRDSAGPVFYRGPRVGKGGKTFGILKFRTMVDDGGSSTGPRLTAQDDPRITPLGKWLRDTKINELPQLWNVLVGDMAFVGPRPEDPELASQWPPAIRKEILSVRPGMTSPASVQFRNEEGLLASTNLMETYVDSILPDKLRLDQLYVRHRSILLDIDTLFWTILVLLPQVKTYAPPDTLLFLGPASRFFRRYANWFTVDALVALAAMGLAGIYFRSLSPLDIGWPTAIMLALLFAVIFSIGGMLTGVQRIAWRQASPFDALSLIPAVVLSATAVLLINRRWPNPYVDSHDFYFNANLVHPAMILTATVLAFVGFVVVRYRARLLYGFASYWLAWRGLANKLPASERVLIVGGGESGQFASWLIEQRNRKRTIKVVGFVDDDLFKQGVRIHGLNVLGMRKDIPSLVARHDVGVILFAIHKIGSDERDEILQICHKTRARVVMVPDVASALMAAIENRPASVAEGSPG